MKKIWKGLLGVCCAVITACSLSACAEGDSAYKVAQKNGYAGDEKAWLLSLKGEKGEDGEDADVQAVYEAAKENGYEGNFLDFLKEYFSLTVNEDNNTRQIAQNMMSVVSINCGFSKLVYTFQGAYVQYYQTAGSGVILEMDGDTGSALIVTNYHVIYDSACRTDTGISDCIYLYPYGALSDFSPTENIYGDGIEATYVGGAMDYDIALLRVDNSQYIKDNKEVLSAADIGNSEKVVAGEKVYAIGNPEGAGISVTSGAISVESEYITMKSTDGSEYVSYRVMRTDAAINGGNSGGALFDADGKLIGITNAKNVSEETDNVGFALPITQVCYLCDNIIENGTGYAKCAVMGSEIAVKTSAAKFDEEGHVRIEEVLYVTAAAENATSADYNKFQQLEVLEWIKVGDGEICYLTREYLLYDQLLKVRKDDEVTFGVRADNGTLREVSVTFTTNAHFKTYR